MGDVIEVFLIMKCVIHLRPYHDPDDNMATFSVLQNQVARKRFLLFKETKYSCLERNDSPQATTGEVINRSRNRENTKQTCTP